MNNSKKAFSYVLNLLAKRAYSESELRKKLQARKLITSEEIDQLIDKLKKVKYVDDRLFAENYIYSQLRRKPQGIKMLEQNLRKKGIAKEIINDKLQKVELDEKELALSLIRKKETSLKNLNLKQKEQKLYRFLLARGFKAETIYQVLKADQ